MTAKKSIKYLITLILALTLTFNINASAKVTKTSGTVFVGQSTTLKVYKCKKKVKWSSSNKKIAKVKSINKTSAKITGVKAGKATITGKIGSKKIVSAKITVKKQITCKNHLDIIEDEKEATCTSEGYIKYKCLVCNHKHKEIIPKSDHEFVKKDVIAPTPTSDGYTLYVCKHCKKEEKRDITKYVANNISEEDVRNKLAELKTIYDGKSMNDFPELKDTYTSKVLGEGKNCAAWAFFASDYIFGDRPFKSYTYSNSNLHIGDIIETPTHYMIVADITTDEWGQIRIYVADAPYGNDRLIQWPTHVWFESMLSGSYIITRY